MANKDSQYTQSELLNPFMWWSQVLPAKSDESVRGHAFDDAASNLFASMVAVNEECARFIKMRLSRDVDHVQGLARCQSPIEAGELHREWLQSTVNDYVSETYTLLELGSRFIGPRIVSKSDKLDAPVASKSR